MGQGQALPTDTYIGIKDNLLSFSDVSTTTLTINT